MCRWSARIELGCQERNGPESSEPGRMSHDMMKGFLHEQRRTDRIMAAVKTVSEQVGRSMAQVAERSPRTLRWR